MTRKDYVLIAKSLNYSWTRQLEAEEGEAAQVVLRTAETLATALGNENPRFDRNIFMAAVKEK